MKTAEWLQALRSGKYKQIKRKLSDGVGGFCCLGVLCEAKNLPKKTVGDSQSISGLHVTYIFDLDGDSQVSLNHSNYFSAGVIPQAYQPTILEDLDLTMDVEDPCDGGKNDLASVLMNMNDDGKSFAKIADYIETVVKTKEAR